MPSFQEIWTSSFRYVGRTHQQITRNEATKWCCLVFSTHFEKGWKGINKHQAKAQGLQVNSLFLLQVQTNFLCRKGAF